ncbi:MAG: TIGR03546 family protein [Thermodesulfobacteriota bacterium]
MLKLLAKILKVLNSETEPGQISLGLCFAMIMGFTPLFSLHNLLVLLLVLVLRVNLSMFIVGWGIFSGIAYLLDPLFHALGLAVLQSSALESLWVVFYNMVLFRLDRFNNSIVMGSLLISLGLFVPLYFTANWLIRKYRENVLAWVRQLRIVESLQASRLFQIYQSLSN